MGIHLFGNNWGIASGGNLNNVAPAPTGQWTYVMGTFSKNTNRATLYVGNDNAGIQTTASGFRADGQGSTGLLFVEIGRYDNQDLDAKVDDAMFWNEALTVHEANAVRNLRLAPGLDYSPLDAEALFGLFDAGSGTVDIGGMTWSITSGLSGSPGRVPPERGLGLAGGRGQLPPGPALRPAVLNELDERVDAQCGRDLGRATLRGPALGRVRGHLEAMPGERSFHALGRDSGLTRDRVNADMLDQVPLPEIASDVLEPERLQRG